MNNIIAEVMDDVYLHYHDEKVLDNFKMGTPNVTTGEIQNYLKEIQLHYSFKQMKIMLRQLLNISTIFMLKLSVIDVWDSPFGMLSKSIQKWSK